MTFRVSVRDATRLIHDKQKRVFIDYGGNRQDPRKNSVDIMESLSEGDRAVLNTIFDPLQSLGLSDFSKEVGMSRKTIHNIHR